MSYRHLAALALTHCLSACYQTAAPPDDHHAGPPGSDASGTIDPPAVEDLDCSDIDMRSIDMRSAGGPDVRTRTTGTNGAFQDECDESGDLVEYICESRRCGHDSDPCSVATGAVVALAIDCDGQCQDGACWTRCPDFGDVIAYRSIDESGSVIVDNQTDGRAYACDLVWDSPGDSFDCRRDVEVGMTDEIVSLGLHDLECTGGIWGSIGVAAGRAGDIERCAYECRYSIP